MQARIRKIRGRIKKNAWKRCFIDWIAFFKRKRKQRNLGNRTSARYKESRKRNICHEWKLVAVLLARKKRWFARSSFKRVHFKTEAILNGWRRVKDESSHRKHCSSAIRHKRQASQKCHACRLWRELVTQKKTHQRIFGQILQHRSTIRIAFVVQLWREVSSKCRRLQKLTQKAHIHSQRRLIFLVVKAWNQSAIKDRLIHRKFLLISKHIQGLGLASAMEEWRKSITKQLRFKHILGRSHQQSGHRLMRTAFHAFQITVMLHQRGKRQRKSAESHYTRILLCKIISVFGSNSRSSKRLKRIVQKLGCNAARRTIENIFAEWRQRAIRNRKNKFRHHKISVQVNKQLLQASCSTWFESTQINRRLRLVLGKSKVRFGHQFLCNSIAEWRKNVIFIKRQRMAVKKLKKHHIDRTVVLVVNGWHLFADHSKRINKAVRKLKVRVYSGSISVEFEHWKEEIKSTKRIKRAFQVISQHTSFSIYELVCETWWQYVQLSRRVKKLRGNVSSHIMRDSEKNCFEIWRHLKYQNKRLNSKSALLSQHMRNHSTARVFCAWSSEISSIRRQKTALSRCKPRSQGRAMQAAMNGWKLRKQKRAELLAAAKETYLRLCKFIYRQAWASWRENVIIVRTMLILSGRASTRNASQLYAWALSRWRSEAEELKRRRAWMAKLANRMRHLVEAGAFMVIKSQKHRISVSSGDFSHIYLSCLMIFGFDSIVTVDLNHHLISEIGQNDIFIAR